MKKIISLLLLGAATTMCSVKAGEFTSNTYILDHYQVVTFLKNNGYDVMKSWEDGRSLTTRNVTKKNVASRKIDLSKIANIVDYICKLGFTSYDKKDEIYEFLKQNELLFLCGAQKCGYFDNNTRNLSAWAKKIKEGYKKLQQDNPELFKVFEKLIKQAVEKGIDKVTTIVPITQESKVEIDDLCEKLIEVITPQTKGLILGRNKADKRFLTPSFHVIFELSKGQITLTGLPQIPQAFFDGIESFSQKSIFGKLLTGVGLGAMILGGADSLLNKGDISRGAYNLVPAKVRMPLENNIVAPVQNFFNKESAELAKINALDTKLNGFEAILQENNKLSQKNFDNALVEMKKLMNHGGQALIDACKGNKAKENDAICKLVNLAVGVVEGNKSAELETLKLQNTNLTNQIKKMIEAINGTATKLNVTYGDKDDYAVVLKKVKAKTDQFEKELNAEKEALNKEKLARENDKKGADEKCTQSKQLLTNQIKELSATITTNQKRFDIMNKVMSMLKDLK